MLLLLVECASQGRPFGDIRWRVADVLHPIDVVARDPATRRELVHEGAAERLLALLDEWFPGMYMSEFPAGTTVNPVLEKTLRALLHLAQLEEGRARMAGFHRLLPKLTDTGCATTTRLARELDALLRHPPAAGDLAVVPVAGSGRQTDPSLDHGRHTHHLGEDPGDELTHAIRKEVGELASRLQQESEVQRKWVVWAKDNFSAEREGLERALRGAEKERDQALTERDRALEHCDDLHSLGDEMQMASMAALSVLWHRGDLVAAARGRLREGGDDEERTCRAAQALLAEALRPVGPDRLEVVAAVEEGGERVRTYAYVWPPTEQSEGDLEGACALADRLVEAVGDKARHGRLLQPAFSALHETLPAPCRAIGRAHREDMARVLRKLEHVQSEYLRRMDSQALQRFKRAVKMWQKTAFTRAFLHWRSFVVRDKRLQRAAAVVRRWLNRPMALAFQQWRQHHKFTRSAKRVLNRWWFMSAGKALALWKESCFTKMSLKQIMALEDRLKQNQGHLEQQVTELGGQLHRERATREALQRRLDDMADHRQDQVSALSAELERVKAREAGEREGLEREVAQARAELQAALALLRKNRQESEAAAAKAVKTEREMARGLAVAEATAREREASLRDAETALRAKDASVHDLAVALKAQESGMKAFQSAQEAELRRMVRDMQAQIRQVPPPSPAV